MIDLHTHSTASDGELSPQNLVIHAGEKHISVLALTDHDTLAGLAEAQLQAEKMGITFIPGVELNIAWSSGEFHLLGLGIDTVSKSLETILEDLQAGRINRNKAIIESLQKGGFDVSLEEMYQSAGSECIGRPHIAKYLVEKSIAKNIQKAFDLFLAKNRPYHVERYGCPLERAIVAIKDSGGIPIIAHPLSLYISWGKMESVIAELATCGIQGLEAWHPAARVADCERLEALAKNYQLLITAGSDFHGYSVRKDREIGLTSGKLPILEHFWTEELQRALVKKI